MSDEHNQTSTAQAHHSRRKQGAARRRGGRTGGRTGGRSKSGNNGGDNNASSTTRSPSQVGPSQGKAAQGQQAQGQQTQGKTMRRPKKRKRSNPPTAKPPTAAKAGTAGSVPASRKRRRKSKGRSGKVGNNVHYIGQVTNDTSVPTPAPPRRRGKRKRPLANPRIGVGCIILQGDQILLVRERGRWSLPKGGLEQGELVQDGARRETYEESGLVIELSDLAFIVEFKSDSWGHHLQFFYTGRVVGGKLGPKDPDKNVQEALFVPISQLREYIRFRPRLMSLETWLAERRPRHFVFDLDHQPAMTRRKRAD